MSSEEPRLVLLGRQGAGKGTQSIRLADHFGVIHVSTGDIFRTQATQGTAFGLEAKRFMDAGDLVPDEIVVGVIEECLAPGGPLQDGFVLDTTQQLVEIPGEGRSAPMYVNADVRTMPNLTIARHERRIVDLYYPLPATIRGDAQLPRFELLWQVDTASRTVASRTDFDRAEPAPTRRSNRDAV